MNRTLDEVIAELAVLHGSAYVDTQDGHGRWALYRQAIDAEQPSDLLLDVVALEPDPSIALSLVLHILEEVPEGDRPTWISRLVVSKDRDYATKRAKELGIFEAAMAGRLAVNADANAPNAWSDWLQLRLAETCLDRTILDVLTEHGRTKRIRRIASDRVRSLNS
jgi:hypothetical protein